MFHYKKILYLETLRFTLSTVYSFILVIHFKQEIKKPTKLEGQTLCLSSMKCFNKKKLLQKKMNVKSLHCQII